MRKFALAYLHEAENRLKTAQRAFKEGEYAYCVRQSQEAVELSLKAALRLKGIEYPKVHDVSDVLIEVKEMYPGWFSNQVDKLAKISKILVEKREVSFYGLEEEYITQKEAITENHARKSVKDAEYVFKICKKLLMSI